MGGDENLYWMDRARRGGGVGGGALVDIQRLRLPVHSFGYGGNRPVPLARGVAAVERGRATVFCVGHCVWIRLVRLGGGSGRGGWLAAVASDDGRGEIGVRRVCAVEDRVCDGRGDYFRDRQFDRDVD